MHLDIEGTKHEKVVIIVLAYILGFTASFISFGLTRAPSSQPKEVVIEQPATVVESAPEPVVAEPESLMEEPSEIEMGPLNVTYTNGKLQATIAGETYLLSMKQSDPSLTEAGQGTHVDIPKFLVSPDSSFVYFCEQQTIESICTNFVFDVTKNIIRFVTLDGTKFSTSVEAANAADWSTDGLTLDGAYSSDPAEPSLLTRN